MKEELREQIVSYLLENQDKFYHYHFENNNEPWHLTYFEDDKSVL